MHTNKIERQEWLEKLKTRRFKTRGQWFHGFQRRVVVPDSEAQRVITTAEGRTLYLFDESQTETE